MTPINDLDINRHIRQALVRHWIDLGRLSIRSIRGKVTIHGLLDRIAGVKEKLTPTIVDGMMRDLKRINGVERLTIELSNWTMRENHWVQVDRAQREIKGETETADLRKTTYDID